MNLLNWRFLFRLYWFPVKILYVTSVISAHRMFYRIECPLVGSFIYGIFNALLAAILLLNIYWFLVIFLDVDSFSLIIFIASVYVCFSSSFCWSYTRYLENIQVTHKIFEIMKKQKRTKNKLRTLNFKWN